LSGTTRQQTVWVPTLCVAVTIASLCPLHALEEGPKTTNDAASPKLTPLEIEFPHPMLKSYTNGPPTKVRLSPASQRSEFVPPLKIMVPTGTRNLALGKAATSSSEPVGADLKLLTDGEKGGKDYKFIEFGPEKKQWVQIDLGEECEIFAVAIWRNPYDWSPHVYRDVVVQLASDQDMTRGVHCVFNNDDDNSLGLGKGEEYEYFDDFEGKVIPCVDAQGHGTRARYLRSWTNGHIVGPDLKDEMTRYSEIEVWGIAAEPKK
jgi:hypothetical protein